jgi:serralysin
MWGDAMLVHDNAVGGNDTFVFAPENGGDIIFDFEQGKDHIDLKAYASAGFDDFGDLNIETVGEDSVIYFDTDNNVTVRGVASLQITDFIF